MKIYLKGIGWSGVDWMDLVQDRDKGQDFVCAVMNLHVSYKDEERLELDSIHEWKFVQREAAEASEK